MMPVFADPGTAGYSTKLDIAGSSRPWEKLVLRYGAVFQKNMFLVVGGLLTAGYWISRLATAGDEDNNDRLMHKLTCISSAVEHFGLLSLLLKITKDGNVAGLSGKTMVVYLCEYTLRFLVTCEFSKNVFTSGELPVDLLYALSIAWVMRVIYCVFWKHRESYQAEYDSFPVHFQILACLLIPAFMEANVQMGPVKDYMWNACMWLEMTALLPQVYMVAKAQAPVDGLISHFVAATALSRFVDLIYWYFAFELVGTGADGAWNFSGMLIVACHTTHAMLLADFMYYYLRFRVLSAGGMFEAMPIPEHDCVSV